MDRRPGRVRRARTWRHEGGVLRRRTDVLATEEPLEVRVEAGGTTRTVAITMRTPGDDFELAVGFLHGEGVITGPGDVRRVAYCLDPALGADQRYNVVTVTLSAGVTPDLRPLDRHVVTTSACGVCGKASIDALHVRGCPAPPAGVALDGDTLLALPDRLRVAQAVFERTGGLHAAALFDLDGAVIAAREDVGRHNALDKLIGRALLDGRLPLHHHVVVVSGRASYELVQKSVAAGVPVVCAVSAPSSLAVDVAREFGVTLVGFLRDGGFNVYAHPDRIVSPAT
ncbi:MAG TPA: formate dehydrogenase accessory sulfurtransferase FdhD [Nitriliruptorales bacterium]|nr:formate dehydrogenase accessory sulfurtransferase FdhD [Nitriliruptorales bacterium]